MGIVLTHKKIGYRSKMTDKEKEAFFVGYATEHASDIYCMHNHRTKRIKISRDVRWMGKFYNDGHLIKIPDNTENKSRNVKSITPPIRCDDAHKKNHLMKQALNEKKYSIESNYK